MSNTERADQTVVILPARNEARTIVTIAAHIRKLGFEAIVVDDGSTDATASAAERAGSEVLKHKSSSGYTAAVLTGMAEAILRGADHIATIDADGAHDPADLSSLLKVHAARGHALTIGDRFASEGLQANSSKYLVNHLPSAMLRAALSSRLPRGDYACGLRVYSRALADALVHEAPHIPAFGMCFFSAAFASGNEWGLGFAPCTVRYDASQLLCTSRDELADFFGTVAEVSRRLSFRETCLRFRDSTLHMETMRFVIGGRVIYAVPLRPMSGYIFQEQSAFFEASRAPRAIPTIRIDQ